MKKVVIFGGSGFLGLSLADYLETKGFVPILIARHYIDTPYRLILWDGYSIGSWCSQLEGAEAVVNFAGKSVNCRKTPDNRDLILRSRLEATEAIGEALKRLKKPPKVWVQMSTAHIYGDPPTRRCNENSITGVGLAPEVGKAWEQKFRVMKPDSVRGIVLRTAFVLGASGGAYKELKTLVRLGFGSAIASGKQGMSWIHQRDFNRIVFQAIVNDYYSGVYNVTSPYPCSNAELMKQLRKVLGWPIAIPLPTWALRIGARWILKTDEELAIYGRYVIPEKLLVQGFRFRFPKIQDALLDIVATTSKS